MDSSQLIVLDTETTGLDRERHEVWELAYDIDGQETVMHFPVDISRADPMALKMNGFYDRYPFANFLSTDDNRNGGDAWVNAADVETFVSDARGKHILGACPSFDDNFLWKLVRKFGFIETWHYHLIDIENLIVGYLLKSQLTGMADELVSLPWKSEDLSRAVGVDPEEFDRHSALGDVKWAKAQLDAILMSPPRNT